MHIRSLAYFYRIFDTYYGISKKLYKFSTNIEIVTIIQIDQQKWANNFCFQSQNFTPVHLKIHTTL